MASHYNSIFALMKAECLQKVVRQPKENIYLRNKEIQLHTYGHFIQCLCKDTDESSLVCVVLAWLIKMLHQIITKRHTENQHRLVYIGFNIKAVLLLSCREQGPYTQRAQCLEYGNDVNRLTQPRRLLGAHGAIGHP